MTWNFKDIRKKTERKILVFLVTYVAQPLLRLIMKTCTVEIDGLSTFTDAAKNHKCILVLWHNRLALVPYALSTYAPQFIYAAFISKSRDGELLAAVAKSYPTGRVITVSHQARHQALKEVVRRLEENREIILMTPDGPRGPQYKVKPGVALAAQLASAHVIPWTWTSTTCWKLKTWDQLMLPKPFSTVKIKFGMPLLIPEGDIQASTAILQEALMQFSDSSSSHSK